MEGRVDLLSVHVDPIDLDAAMRAVRESVQTRRPRQIVTVNVDFLKLAKQDRAFAHLLNTADLVVADGMPLVWAARLAGTPMPARITGMDVVLASAELAAAEGYGIFLLGAAPGVAARAGQALRTLFPGLRVCGAYAPPHGAFSVEEEENIVGRVRASRPDILYVAFGAPRQDIWIREHMAQLDVPVAVGVGGVLNFLAGTVRRAPSWMQRAGLEWLYRLIQEPGRLWRRYLIEDLPVFVELLAQPRTDTRGDLREGRPSPANPFVAVRAEGSAGRAARQR